MDRTPKIIDKHIIISGRGILRGLMQCRLINDYTQVTATELPEEFVSLTDMVDFFIDVKALSSYISFYEKIVLNNIYRVKPLTFGLVGFYDKDGYGIRNVFSGYGEIRFTTTQWYSWPVRPIYVSNPDLIDYLYSYSSFMPSTFRPGLINVKCYYPPIDLNILLAPTNNTDKYINNPTLLRLLKRVDGTIIYPLNAFTYMDLDPIDLLIDAREDRVVETDDGLIEKYRRIVSVKIPIKGGVRQIFPFIFMVRDKYVLGFIEAINGRTKIIYGSLYESDDYVVDLLNEYRGIKVKVFFSRMGLNESRKGFSIRVNLVNGLRPITFSRLNIDYMYGGKIIYSSPSGPNIYSYPYNLVEDAICMLEEDEG